MNMIGKYEEICTLVEEEFARNRRLHGDRIQCRAGCADCCSQLFQITEIEAGVIWDAMQAMSSGERAQLQTKAQAYLVERGKMVSAQGEPEAWGSLPPVGTRLACPALVDGRCRIYESRPLICRKFGIPLWNPDRPGRVYACELNFQEGEEIVDGELIQIQTAIHEEWKQVQAGYNRAGGPREADAICVARAMVEELGGLPCD
ncbi:MAG: YkgJ family cysteine cluster protein [Acidobacteriia bacterium]|nr:YkgJ family cysteine cluster protein [Terriglobia bacterium]